MGVIDVCNVGSFGLVKLNNNNIRRPVHTFEANHRRIIITMASNVDVEHVKEATQQLTGDSFIRSHLKKLAPYQPILPFEVSGVFNTFTCHAREV